MIESHVLRKTLTHGIHSPRKLQAFTHSAAVTDPQPDPQSTYPHMASLRYLNPVTLDSYLYRCAALVAKENFVLTSAYCAGLEDVIQMPNRVRLDLVVPFKEELVINVGSITSSL